MASGRKNYFRHSFFARNDLKLNLLKDEVGVGFYFYYFSLLEICGEASDSELKDKYVFHDSIIRNLWRVNLKKCRAISDQMNAVGLLEFKKVEKSFEFTIPNFSKYLGKYTNKKDSNSSNKIKENKIKLNKIKTENGNAKNPKFNEPHLIQLWNDNFPAKLFRAISIGRGKTFDNFQISIGYYPDKTSWIGFYEKIKNSKKLMSSEWANFTYFLNYDNILKLIDGTLTAFEKEESINSLDGNAIRKAIASGALRVEDCNGLRAEEKEFIRDKGGLYSLNRLSNFDLSKLIKDT